jgi:hypothetical protein
VTPEDRLRRLLHEHDDVPVAGDGLARIRQRLDARRSRVLVPAAALTGAVVAAAVGVYAVSVTDDGTVRPQPPAVHASAQPSPTSTACSGGLCSEPRPSPSLPLTGVTTSGDGIPVWPFTSDAQAADWVAAPGDRTWAADPVQVAQHLLDDVLALPGTAVGTAGGGDVVRVVVRAGGRPVSTVQLEQVGRGPNGPWAVTGASAEDVGITTPDAGGSVESPLTVTGRVTGVDESVHVQLLAGSTQLADGHAPAGAEQPWSQLLRWSSTTWSTGAVVASTYDGKGDLHALALTPVRRGGAGSPGVPAAGSTLLAVQDGHIVLADALTGKRLRQLSYPGDGDVDSDPGRGGTDGVVWVRTRGDGCTSSVIRIGLAHGPAGVTVEAKPRHRRLPALSAGGSRLAWVEGDCTPGAVESLVVRGPDARFVTVLEVPGHVTAIDVRDDGTALVGLSDAAYVVPPGSTSFTAARRLTAAAGCTVSAPAWDDAVATAWQRCSDGSRLTRFAGDGRAVSTSPAVADPVSRMSVADGFVLVVRGDGTPARFSEGRLTAVPAGEGLLQASW